MKIRNVSTWFLAILLSSCLMLTWSCTNTSGDAHVIKLNTYLIYASENGEQVKAPIFPGELSVNYIDEILQNIEQIQENLRKTYGYEVFDLQSETQDLIHFREDEQYLSALFYRRNFSLTYRLVNNKPVISPQLFTYGPEGKKDLLHTRLNFVDDKTIVLGLGQPKAEKRSALFLILQPKTFTINDKNDIEKVRKMSLTDLSHQIQAYKLSKEISAQLKLPFNKIENYENLFAFFEVSAKPRMLRKAAPKYPEKARKAATEGTVVTTILIREDGTVADASVFKSVDPALDSAAVAASKNCLFEPGELDGKKVKTLMNIPYRFRLDGSRKNDLKAIPIGQNLTKNPQLIKQILPELPKDFNKALLPDMNLVLLKIDKNGKVIEATIKRAAKNKELDKLSVETAGKYEFIPGEIDGKAVESKVIIPFKYELK